MSDPDDATELPTEQDDAPYPGATVPVTQHIDRAAARAHLSHADWLNHHFDTYFDLDEPDRDDEVQEVYRHTETGQFVSADEAEKHPDTVEVDHV